MGICIDKLPHSCGTRQGLQVFVDEETQKLNGWCFSCKTFVANPYGEEKTIDDIELPEPKTEAEIAAELAEIDGYGFHDVKSRRLRAKHLEPFNIKVSVSENDGKTPTAFYFPVTTEDRLTGYYVKTIGENSIEFAVGETKNGQPINWVNAKRSGAYRLIITEGALDMASVGKIYQLYGNDEYIPAVVSLTNGAGSVVKNLTPIAEDIKRLFSEVVLCFDNDEPGQKAVEDAMLILPKAKSVILPYKDANDCVLNGAENAAYKALRYQAEVPKNTRIIMGSSLHDIAREQTPYGELTWPYPSLDKLTRGIRYGETIYIGAGAKMGKSELLNDIAAHFIKVHNVSVFMAKPEEENKKTYKLVCGKLVGKVFHDPNVPFDYDAYDKAGEMLKDDKLMMVDLYQHLGWKSLKKDIITAAALGAKAVFIDPITNLINGIPPAEANTVLQEIAQDLAAMAKDLDIVIFIFCHLKAPEGFVSKDARRKKYEKGEFVGLGSCPHEFGGDVYSSQFSGSRAMMRSCNLMLGLEGNKDPELPEQTRNMRHITILEDREFGNSGRIPLYWNSNTTLFKEV